MSGSRVTDKDKRIRSKIMKYIKQGLRPTEASILAGISRQTYYRWRDNDKTFVTELERAEAALEMKIAKSIKDIATTTKNANALVSFAERRFKDNWATKTTTELTGANGQSVVFKVDASGGYLPPNNVLGVPSTLTTNLTPTLTAKQDNKTEPS